MAETKRIDVILGARDRATSVIRRLGKTVASTAARFSKVTATFGAAALAAAAGGMVALANRAAENIDVTAKLAARLGETTESIVGLQLAARHTGSSTQGLNSALDVMQKRLGEVQATGSGAAKKGLDILNLSVSDLIGLSPTEQFKRIAEQVRDLDDASAKAAATSALFSRANQGLVNTLELGRAGLNAAQREAEQLNLTFDRFDAAKVEAANDAIAAMKESFMGIGVVVAVNMSEPIERFASRVRRLVSTIGDDIGRLFSAISGGLLNLVSRGLRALAGIADKVEPWIDSLARRVEDFFALLPERALYYATKVRHAIVSEISKIVQDLADDQGLFSRVLGVDLSGVARNLASSQASAQLDFTAARDRLREAQQERQQKALRNLRERRDTLWQERDDPANSARERLRIERQILEIIERQAGEARRQGKSRLAESFELQRESWQRQIKQRAQAVELYDGFQSQIRPAVQEWVSFATSFLRSRSKPDGQPAENPEAGGTQTPSRRESAQAIESRFLSRVPGSRADLGSKLDRLQRQGEQQTRVFQEMSDGVRELVRQLDREDRIKVVSGSF